MQICKCRLEYSNVTEYSADTNEGKPTEPMWAEGEPLEVEQNSQPEHLEDEGKQVSMGAEGRAWNGGNPQPEP
jgi:hypothetical protein